MGFKENLRDEISYQGLLIKELAAKAGLNAGSISNYLKENSSIPSADIAVKIADALHVSVEFLVTGKEKKENTSSTYLSCISTDEKNILNDLNSCPKNIQKTIKMLIHQTAGALENSKN